jgi:hypothetical protein
MTVLQNMPFSAAGSIVTHREGDDATTAALKVAVAERRLRRELGGPVRLEKVFALVPRYENGLLEWDKHALHYSGSKRASDGAKVDDHERVIDVDGRAVHSYGVAFGMETDRGVLWLQDYEENWTVIDRATYPERIV